MKRREWLPLTDEQRQFATEHHNLIYSFLYYHKLDKDQWYDVVAIGYIRAVINHDPQVCAFSTRAYKSMKSAVSTEQKYQHRQRRSATLVSFEEMQEHGKESYINEDFSDAFISEILQCLSDRERRVYELTARQYTAPEISVLTKISRRTICRDRSSIRRKLKEAIAK